MNKITIYSIINHTIDEYLCGNYNRWPRGFLIESIVYEFYKYYILNIFFYHVFFYEKLLPDGFITMMNSFLEDLELWKLFFLKK